MIYGNYINIYIVYIRYVARKIVYDESVINEQSTVLQKKELIFRRNKIAQEIRKKKNIEREEAFAKLKEKQNLLYNQKWEIDIAERVRKLRERCYNVSSIRVEIVVVLVVDC